MEDSIPTTTGAGATEEADPSARQPSTGGSGESIPTSTGAGGDEGPGAGESPSTGPGSTPTTTT
jgi:hypothetical protein